MPGSTYKVSSPWENRFRTPGASDLLGVFPKPVAQLLEGARAHFKEIPGVRESIAWQGMPWRWTFVYRSDADPSTPIVYIVPEPGKPRLVLPISREMLARVQVRKLTKPARDALAHGVEVDGVHWAEWDISSKALLDEVLGVATASLGAPIPAVQG